MQPTPEPASPPSLWAAAQGWARKALVNRNFTLFLGGSFVTALGSWFQSVAIGWLILELENSSFLLGLSNFAMLAPLLLLGLVGGALADRTDRRRLLLITQIIVLLLSIVLAGVTYAHWASIPLVLFIILLMGITNAFLWPAWPTFIKDLVGQEHLRMAIATNSARYNLTRVAGPALAGIFLAQFGTAACLAVGAASGVAVIASIVAIRIPKMAPQPGAPWISAIREGLVYAWHDRAVQTIMIVCTFVTSFGMSYQPFMPAFARNVLQVEAWGLGLLLTAVGLGAVVGAVFSGSGLANRYPYHVLAILGSGTGVMLVLFALAPNFTAAMVVAVVLGFCSIGFLVCGNATVQIRTPPALMGRVMGLWVVVNAGTMPVGALLLGALAEFIASRLPEAVSPALAQAQGLQASLALAGAISLVSGLWLFRLVPRRQKA
jgi:MFS family permease